jgi:FMN phosphatase YigB (HAD superfamily)
MSGAAVVLLDFGGTLDADGIHWAPRFHAAYRSGGGTVDYPAFELIYRASDHALAGQAGIRTRGFRDLIELQTEFVLALLPDGADVDAAQVVGRFHHDALAVVARNRPILARLSARYRLGVVSNFCGNLEPCLQELDLRRYFSVVADSAVVGIAKPDFRIFAGALSALDAPAAGAWMVGDNFEADIRPATELGMFTCWLGPLERPLPIRAAPTVRVARFPDLEEALQLDVGSRPH